MFATGSQWNTGSGLGVTSSFGGFLCENHDVMDKQAPRMGAYLDEVNVHVDPAK